VHFSTPVNQLPTTHNQLHTVFCRRATIQFFLENEVQKIHPEKPYFPEKKHKPALDHAINKRQKLTPAKWSKNSQTPRNAEPNRPRARKVLKNSPTTIPARHRKIRHLMAPSCANINPENTQQFQQEKTLALELRVESREERVKTGRGVSAGDGFRPGYTLL
jgi:hypothetical protein